VWHLLQIVIVYAVMASNIHWQWTPNPEGCQVWPFDPDLIADQLGIGVRRLVAFLLPCACLFRIVYLCLFACRPASDRRRPWCVSDGSSRVYGVGPMALSKVSSRVS